jgi:hypothetical protein
MGRCPCSYKESLESQRRIQPQVPDAKPGFSTKPKPTIPVTTMLKLFGGQYLEVAASQSFHDGNLDIRWKKGAVITSPLEELWTPVPPVTAENINHLKNRVDQFTVVGKLKKKDLKAVPNCKFCFCRRMVEQSAAFATQLPATVSLLVPPSADQEAAGSAHGDGEPAVHMMDWLRQRARLSDAAATALTSDLVQLGAVSAQELEPEDWEGLPCWMQLKPFERKRLLRVVEREE